MYTNLKILLQFVSSDPEMLGIPRRYTRLHKTTQPGIQACPMCAHQVLQYREPATRAPDTHPLAKTGFRLRLTHKPREER